MLKRGEAAHSHGCRLSRTVSWNPSRFQAFCFDTGGVSAAVPHVFSGQSWFTIRPIIHFSEKKGIVRFQESVESQCETVNGAMQRIDFRRAK